MPLSRVGGRFLARGAAEMAALRPPIGAAVLDQADSPHRLSREAWAGML